MRGGTVVAEVVGVGETMFGKGRTGTAGGRGSCGRGSEVDGDSEGGGAGVVAEVAVTPESPGPSFEPSRLNAARAAASRGVNSLSSAGAGD